VIGTPTRNKKRRTALIALSGEAVPDTLTLYRYDGAGNDFLILDLSASTQVVNDTEHAAAHAALSRHLCDRSTAHGGADGLLVLLPPEHPTADFTLRIYNADGSVAEMCGNGARCAAFHWFWVAVRSGRQPAEDAAHEPSPSGNPVVVMDTFAGLILGEQLVAVDFENLETATVGTATRVRIDLGDPRFTWKALGFVSQPGDPAGLAGASSLNALPLQIDGQRLTLYGASMGNPHAVTFVNDAQAVDLDRVGPAVEHDPHFARGTNFHLIQSVDRHHLIVRHWERGCGQTQACGTGAVASAVVAIQRGIAFSPVRVDVPGGELCVTWTGGTAQLEGPAVANGTLVLDASVLV
jgi:diaminopimelate epimerase